MTGRLCVCTALLCAAAVAQAVGTKPKPRATDYPASGRMGKTTIGAEYLASVLPGEKGSYAVPKYLVVEVALYPAGEIEVSAGHFQLRVNGRKELLRPQNAFLVAAALRSLDYDSPGLQAGIGPVIIGGSPQPGRFPGDPTADRNSGAEPGEDGPKAAQTFALPEGPAKGPVSGYLYFPYKGKLKSIRSLELLCGEGAEPIRLY